MRMIERRIATLEAASLARVPPKPWAVFVPSGPNAKEAEQAFRAQHQGQDVVIVSILDARRPSHEGA